MNFLYSQEKSADKNSNDKRTRRNKMEHCSITSLVFGTNGKMVEECTRFIALSENIELFNGSVGYE